MNTMETIALVTMLLGFVLGFFLAARASLELMAKKDAIIQDLATRLHHERVVGENYREEFLGISNQLELLSKYFPDLSNELIKEAQRRAVVDKKFHLLDRDERLDEIFCRHYFDNNLVVEKQTTLKPVKFVKPVIRPANPQLPAVIDLNKQVNNRWPQFFDQLDAIEDAEVYWEDFENATKSPVDVSRQNYFRLEKRTDYGGTKTKWSTVHGREFGAKRKNKITRSKLKQAKRSNKEQWLAFNELYEDDLPYEVEEVILQNKAQSFKKALNELTLEEFLLAK